MTPTMEFSLKVPAAICELRAGNYISEKMPEPEAGLFFLSPTQDLQS